VMVGIVGVLVLHVAAVLAAGLAAGLAAVLVGVAVILGGVLVVTRT